MEERRRYILLRDRVGEILERSLLTLSFAEKRTPTQLLKGELLEALPDKEQTGGPTRIALAGIDRNLRLECRVEDVTKLTTEEADLLLSISSRELRFLIFFDRKWLEFGKRLEHGSEVLVSHEVHARLSSHSHGVVSYKGKLLNLSGTMFEVKITKLPDALFERCTEIYDEPLRVDSYFTYAHGSFVSVGLDKLRPSQDCVVTRSKSPKFYDHVGVLDWWKSPQGGNLKINQRVVTFSKDCLVRGTVRFIGDEKVSSGLFGPISIMVVGLELDERLGKGTGKWKGNQFFVCKEDYACFVETDAIMLQEDYDNVIETSGEQFEENASSRQSTSLQQALEDIQQLKTENNRLKLEKIQQEKVEIVKQIDNLQTDVRAKVHELETSHSSLIASQQALLKDIHQLKDGNKKLKHEKTKLEKERDDLLAQQENHERELQEIQQEKDEIVKQKDNLQTDLRAKESQVHELKTSLTTAQQALEDIQQLKNENNRLKLEKCQWEKEKNDVQEEKDELVAQNNSLQTDLRAKEFQVHELETSLTTAQQALEDIQQLKNENNRLKLEKCQWEKEKNDVEVEKDELVVQNNSLQTDLRAKEAEVHRLETTLATARQALEECQQIKETCDWVVSRDEVQMTDKCLGVGGWGKVSLGIFRGCKVAVKEIHELILSPYNRRLFEREMKIASKCRHPCLLQFIGATNDDGIPLFITELLETSLRALLEQRQLAETEISIISLDVSLALNYLHNMKPSPIIHRDVSSANVLLWRQGDQWRGKVSDYGTANFVEQAMTRAPGAAIYSAPEAVSSNQTPKVDVYSFGVLLCEMCIREMPDPERRKQQVLLVRNHVFSNEVHACLQVDPAKRPDMAQIIQEIQKFKG